MGRQGRVPKNAMGWGRTTESRDTRARWRRVSMDAVWWRWVPRDTMGRGRMMVPWITTMLPIFRSTTQESYHADIIPVLFIRSHR